MFFLFPLHGTPKKYKNTWPHQILLDTGKERSMLYYQETYTDYHKNYKSLVYVRKIFSNREIFDVVSRSGVTFPIKKSKMYAVICPIEL